METVAHIDAAFARNAWNLSDTELVETCQAIAYAQDNSYDRNVRGEAARLANVWLETLSSRDENAGNREQRTALLLGLRKRTIQILVKLTWYTRPPFERHPQTRELILRPRVD